jgi:hypothetical protein
MKCARFTSVAGPILTVSSAWIQTSALDNYRTITMHDGSWVLPPAERHTSFTATASLTKIQSITSNGNNNYKMPDLARACDQVELIA